MPDYYYPNNSYYPQQRPYQQHQNGLLWVQGIRPRDLRGH